MVVTLIGGGSLAAVPAAAQTSDATLASLAADVVRTYPHFSIFDDVMLEARDGVLTVSGCVTMPYKRDDIAARLTKLAGVRSVTNDIHVLPVSPADATLRVRIAQAIYGNPSFRRYASMANPPIHIIVADGRVTLTGVVANEAERTLAFTLAQVAGTLGVANKLKLDTH